MGRQLPDTAVWGWRMHKVGGVGLKIGFGKVL